MRLKELHALFGDPKGLNQSTFWELKALVEQYPYYEPLRFLYLKNALKVDVPFDEFMQDVDRFSLSVQDKKKLLIYLADERLPWNPYFQEEEITQVEQKQVDVFAMIDSFVKDRKTPVSTSLSLKSIAEEGLPYSIDALLADLPDLSSDGGPSDPSGDGIQSDTLNVSKDEPLDQFIRLSQQKSAVRHSLRSNMVEEKTTPSLSIEPEKTLQETIESLDLSQHESDTFAESLAKIYIKQRKFDKACDIFRSLSLKYPEKSVYFADQIRFLELLIKNIKS